MTVVHVNGGLRAVLMGAVLAGAATPVENQRTVSSYLLYLPFMPPRAADADIIFFALWFLMVALWNRAHHYIFILSFVLSSSFFSFLA